MVRLSHTVKRKSLLRLPVRRTRHASARTMGSRHERGRNAGVERHGWAAVSASIQLAGRSIQLPQALAVKMGVLRKETDGLAERHARRTHGAWTGGRRWFKARHRPELARQKKKKARCRSRSPACGNAQVSDQELSRSSTPFTTRTFSPMRSAGSCSYVTVCVPPFVKRTTTSYTWVRLELRSMLRPM